MNTVCTASSGDEEGDEAPAVTIDFPTDGAVLHFGEPVAFVATVTDDLTPAEDLEVSWTSDRAGDLGWATVDTAGVATLEPPNLLSGEHVLSVRVMDGARHLVMASVNVVVDGRPSRPAITLTPEAPTGADDLVVTITEDGVDANRAASELTYSYVWTVDDVLREDQTAAVVPSTSTLRGQTWTVRVAANDPYGPGDDATASVTIGNATPTCETVLMLPNAGNTETAFTCLCSDRADVDLGDPTADTCTFMNAGTAVVATVDVEEGACLLDPALTERGMVLTCVYTPSDGTGLGEPATSAEVLVQNTKPTPPSVVLTPGAGTVGTTFTCEVVADATDADGDDLTIATTWYVNDFPNPGTGSETVMPSQLVSDDAGSPARGGDALRCEAHADDGDLISSAGPSQTVTLDNSAPTGGSVVLGPADAYEDTVLTCVAAEAIDPDGDSVTWTYQWVVDSEPVPDVDSDTLTGEHFDHGQSVVCVATPTDGTDAGTPVASKDAVTILNTLPSIALVNLSPGQTNRPGVFSCNQEGWSDVDGDPVELSHVWWLVGETEDTLLVGHVAETLVPQDAELEPGDQVRCAVTPLNGDASGETVTSLQVGTVINTKPVLSGVSIAPLEAYVDTLLTCELGDLTDEDGDALTVSYAWQNGGVLIAGESEAVLAGVFAKGDAIRCEATPLDPYESGEPLLSDALVIGNKLPTITGVTVTPAHGALCDTFVCAADDIVDTDAADMPVPSYVWTRNGETLDETSDTLDGLAFALVPDDVLQCFVTAWDGALGPEPDAVPLLGESVGSNLVEIVNNAPTLDSVAISETNPGVGDTLTCVPTGFADAECDPEPVYRYQWYIGSEPIVDAEEATLDSAALEEGAVVTCQVWPSDGWNEGVTMLSEAVILGTDDGCAGTPLDGCCTEDTECDDLDPCTTNVCTDGACVGTPIDGCCTENSECDDLNPCTVDACVADLCDASVLVADGVACGDDQICVAGACVAIPMCGDGEQDLDEACDDGNTKPGDGCSEACVVEHHEPGEIIVTEIMANPSVVTDAKGEWVEVYNTTEQDIDINGWRLTESNTSSHVITSPVPVLVPAGGYLVMTRSCDPEGNGGIDPGYCYEAGTVDAVANPSIFLNNDMDAVILTWNGVEIDTVVYDVDAGWPVLKSRSMQLSESALDGQANDEAQSWCLSQTVYADLAGMFGPTDMGTPGAPNESCTCSSESPCNGCQGGSVEPDSCGGCASGELCLEGQCEPLDFALITHGDGTPLEDPLGRYTLSRDFYLATTELTQAAYHALMGPFEFKEEDGVGDDHAAHHITWSMAAAAANAMSAVAGLDESEWCYTCTGCAPTTYSEGALGLVSKDWGLVCVENLAYDQPYDCPGYRLPTEAEWEYAARSGTTSEFWTGQGPELGGEVDDGESCAPAVIEDGVGTETFGDYAWYCANNTPEGTKEVGQKKPNGFGLFDMHGNALEHVADVAGCWGSVLGTSAPIDYPSSVDPWCGPGTGDPEGSRRHRGGSWSNAPKSLGHINTVESPQNVHGHGGIRLARTVGSECVEGAPCDDLNACTTDDLCVGGECVGGGTLSCESTCSCSESICDPAVGCLLGDPITTHGFEGELVGHLPGCWTTTSGTWVVTDDSAKSGTHAFAQTEAIPWHLAIAMEGHAWSATEGLTVSWSMRTENTAGSGWGEHGIVFLYQDPQNYYAMRRDDNGSGHYQHIVRVLDGFETSIAEMGQESTTTGTWGDFTVTATTDGAQVDLTWDCNGWTGSVSDDTTWTSGRVGVFSNAQPPSTAHVLFDDVQIDAERVGARLCEAGTICDIGCEGDEACVGGTTCVGKASSAPGAVGKCVDTSSVEGSGASCDLEAPCGPGLACLGEYAWGGGGWCVEDWFAKTFVSHETVGIPDIAGVSASTSVVACGLATVPVDIYVMVDIDHPRPEDLVVTLHDPNGEQRVISDMEAVIPQMVVVGLPGDDLVKGVWSLEVVDHVPEQIGNLNGWSIYLLSNWD